MSQKSSVPQAAKFVSQALKRDTPLRLIPKEEVKEVLGRSPDIGDTLLMRAWFEIQPAAYKADPATNEAQVRLFNRNAEVSAEFDAA